MAGADTVSPETTELLNRFGTTLERRLKKASRSFRDVLGLLAEESTHGEFPTIRGHGWEIRLPDDPTLQIFLELDSTHALSEARVQKELDGSWAQATWLTPEDLLEIRSIREKSQARSDAFQLHCASQELEEAIILWLASCPHGIKPALGAWMADWAEREIDDFKLWFRLPEQLEGKFEIDGETQIGRPCPVKWCTSHVGARGRFQAAGRS